MSERLAALARRVANDPSFLAFALNEYGRAHDLSDAALAERLGCPSERLPAIQLCRMPRADPARFQADVDRIADVFRIDGDVVAEAARLAEVLVAMRRLHERGAQVLAEEKGGYLMAARDRPEEDAEADDSGREEEP